ncbi:MAG: glutamate synthase [Deltaproteobacteria bacterium RBG_13_61_14]|nr:MAG: glutamate synthase [Deltaproteobacteria bacterium RBG_13_61_14]
MRAQVSNILDSRKRLLAGQPQPPAAKAAEEGGCGVVGFAASVPVRGRHIFEPSIQMHNRGNGKGGGIAAAGLLPEQWGVDEKTLREDYLLQVALLDPAAEAEVEAAWLRPWLRIDHQRRLRPATDFREVGLEVKPPDIVQYFVRVQEDAREKFAAENGLAEAPPRVVEDEFIYQNSYQLNTQFYSSLGEKRAFVLSHARNLAIFKVVGYAEQVVQYYGLEDVRAQVWIAHQRYPTKGRVWHPGGAHPFIGLNQALVHNGDFANFYSISEYLRQHHIAPQFLTDTEVSVLLFDLWHRVYGYPLEYVIEALAPTTELDFERLPEEKRRIYRAIQSLHVHSSPDGPWFFIIAQSEPDQNRFRLLGITDTSMLRPQVFALQEGEISIGLIASEKQAIDATLHSLASEDPRFRLQADRYWNARGGSHTDGGAFVFTVEGKNGDSRVFCADKFGRAITAPAGEWNLQAGAEPTAPKKADAIQKWIEPAAKNGRTQEVFARLVQEIPGWNFGQLQWLVNLISRLAEADDRRREGALQLLTLFLDRRYACGKKKPSAIREIISGAIHRLLDSVPPLAGAQAGPWKRMDWETRWYLRPPAGKEKALVLFAEKFPPEGEECLSRLIVRALQLGWKRFLVYGLRGQRFIGCGLGPNSEGVRLDVFDSSGDYLASGIDGAEIHVHGNGQDQLGQILKRGRLMVYGDVGQAFLYGAKGGEVYVMGNAAGRPLINAVGWPRVVINGTCLDYLAESFMAGDPHRGGGFVILNGIEFDEQGRVKDQESPYPGSNLFSLASGGAIFVRDPFRKLVPEQLNGGEFAELSDEDWNLIRPYLEANERYFGISIEQDLLMVNGQQKTPPEVYCKVRAVKLKVLAKMEVPE